MLIPELALDKRAGLPASLRALVEAFPRETWEAHPNFHGLVAFWLERHMMFRKLHDMLIRDVEAALSRDLAAEVHAQRVSRFGGMMLNELHTHHHVEDDHYFPMLQRVETSLGLGFEILDSDHHALEAALARFAEAANGVIGARSNPSDAGPATAVFEGETRALGQLLLRHLEDEEEIVVPTILKHGPDAFEAG